MYYTALRCSDSPLSRHNFHIVDTCLVPIARRYLLLSQSLIISNDGDILSVLVWPSHRIFITLWYADGYIIFTSYVWPISPASRLFDQQLVQANSQKASKPRITNVEIVFWPLTSSWSILMLILYYTLWCIILQWNLGISILSYLQTPLRYISLPNQQFRFTISSIETHKILMCSVYSW